MGRETHVAARRSAGWRRQVIIVVLTGVVNGRLVAGINHFSVVGWVTKSFEI